MKKLSLIILALLLSFLTANSQNIRVSSFKNLESDLTARAYGTSKMDMNGERAALIKIVTPERDFTFEGSIVSTEYHPGEIWLYIPNETQKISIFHQRYGVLRDYFFTIPIKSASTYEMQLDLGNGYSLAEQTLSKEIEQVVTKQEPQKVTTVNVDKNIPHIAEADRNTFAVIIGNEKYKNEANVPFAENDAKIFKQYVQQTLGVPEKQIRFITNAGLNDLRFAIRWLKQAMEVCNGQGKAIFYYAGHGIPDEADKTAYLLPTDGIGGDPESAFSLQKLYAEFGKMQAQRTMIFLDACFSGSKRDGQMMASARGVAIKVKPMAPEGNMVIFTAAQGDETAYPYKEQQHGLFTYYLLKKLQDSKGNITLGELSDYLTREVKRESFVENNKMQTPTVNVSTTLANSWRSMKLR